ncbi:MAG TPA: hypothetical protein DEX10_00470 [Betaproteobacteria bacterium]|jgi:hypothetical protein|nr:hypothetical protein [Betaproteobacteria bacterium]
MKTGQCITTHEGLSIYEEIDNDGKPTGRVCCEGEVFVSVGEAKAWIDGVEDQDKPGDSRPTPPGSRGPKP